MAQYPNSHDLQYVLSLQRQNAPVLLFTLSAHVNGASHDRPTPVALP